MLFTSIVFCQDVMVDSAIEGITVTSVQDSIPAVPAQETSILLKIISWITGFLTSSVGIWLVNKYIKNKNLKVLSFAGKLMKDIGEILLTISNSEYSATDAKELHDKVIVAQSKIMNGDISSLASAETDIEQAKKELAKLKKTRRG